MPKLNKTQQARWDAARRLFLSLIQAAADNQGQIMFDSTKIEGYQVEISETEINVLIGRCTYNFFVADPEMDAGLYDTISKYEKDIRDQFSVVKDLFW